MKKEKKQREKKYYFRKFVKELRRVRWSKPKENWKAFAQIIVFTILFTTIVVLFATMITLIWKAIGIETI